MQQNRFTGHTGGRAQYALTKRLLAFLRQQTLTTEPVDINASLEEITELLLRRQRQVERPGAAGYPCRMTTP